MISVINNVSFLKRFIFEFRQLRGDASSQPETTPSGRGLLSTVTSALRPPMILTELLSPDTKKERLHEPT